MKNNLIILLDAQGNLITEPIGQLRANAEFNADITVIAPFDLTTVVSATFTKDNRVERDITQYLVPNGTIRGKDILDKDHPEYQRVYDYNVFEGSMNDVALAYVAKFRAGLLFMSIGLGDIVQPPLAINYKGKFGQGVYLPEEAENGDFYICDEYNFNDKDFTFTLDDYAYFYNGEWHKSNYRSLGGTDTFEVSVSPNIKSNVEVTIDQDLGLLLAGRVAVLERAVSDLEGDYIDLEARVGINENDVTNIKNKNIEQDNRLDVIDDNITDIINVNSNQSDTLQDHETRITKNTQDIAEINEGLVRIDNETITRNDNQELEVSALVLNDINSKVKETEFISYQNTVQDFLNGKLDKKPDGVIDLINAFNKIDARYLEIDNELFIVVLELPEVGVGNKIYLVPKTGVDNNNEYDEYIYIDNKWEALGKITIDLSNYYDKNEIDTLLNNKVDKTEFDSHKNNKDNPHGVTKEQVGLSNVTNDKQFTREEFDKLNLVGVKNLGGPDLNGKEHLGNGVYSFYNSDGFTVNYDVYSGVYILNGTYTSPQERSIPIGYVSGWVKGNTYTSTVNVLSSNAFAGDTRFERLYFNTGNSYEPYWNDKIMSVLNGGISKTTYSNQNNNTINFRIRKVSSQESATFNNFQLTLQIEEGTEATDYQIPIQPIIYHETKYLKDEVDGLLDNKVDKVSGKGLSTNDFTDNDKNKLDGIEEGAEVNPYSKVQLDSLFNDKANEDEVSELVKVDETTIDKNSLNELKIAQQILDLINDKIEQDALDGFVYQPTFDNETHTLTLPMQNEMSLVIDLDLERLIMNIDLEDDELVFTFEDGSVKRIPLGSLLVGMASEQWVNDKLDAKVNANNPITAGTSPKITYDAKGLVTGGSALVAGDIPNLDADKITTGTFDVARIPNLAPSKITQNETNRFVTDTEKATWNTKLDENSIIDGGDL